MAIAPSMQRAIIAHAGSVSADEVICCIAPPSKLGDANYRFGPESGQDSPRLFAEEGAGPCGPHGTGPGAGARRRRDAAAASAPGHSSNTFARTSCPIRRSRKPRLIEPISKSSAIRSGLFVGIPFRLDYRNPAEVLGRLWTSAVGKIEEFGGS
jgi:hypothetical protein